MLLSEHKMANMFKAKRLIENGGTRYLNRRSYQLSRQFLITASTFPYSSKNSSAEHIHTLRTCLILMNTLIHMTNRHTHTLTHSLTHTLTNTETYIKASICSAEEFLELYGKVEAVVRNCLLQLSGQLVEIAGTPPFSIILFTLNTLAFLGLRQEHFPAGTLLFLATPKILHAEMR